MDIIEKDLKQSYSIEDIERVTDVLLSLIGSRLPEKEPEGDSRMDVDAPLDETKPADMMRAHHEKICRILPQRAKNMKKNDVKAREELVYTLVRGYIKFSLFDILPGILERIHEFLDQIPNSKTAKIVTNIIEEFSDDPETLGTKAEFLQEMVNWCVKQKRVFLRHRIEFNQARIFHLLRKYQLGLEIIKKLSFEVKKYDDKLLLIELMVLESKMLYDLRNYTKAKTSLTTARANSNAIYIPTELQSEIELQAGILHAEDGDYKTAHSYFLEAYENFKSCGNEKEAVRSLKYVLLCRILSMDPGKEDSSFKSFSATAFDKSESMKAISLAHEHKSLKEFQDVIKQYETELKEDPVVMKHIEKLYDRMLEGNLLMVVQPFSRVEISHLATLIELPPEVIERRLSTMILDKKLNGILDQGRNCLIVHDDVRKNDLHKNSIELINDLDNVVKSLYARANVVQ